mmetsp:Transcript_1576/g.1748  ORF Transcript_1576/g.1748 Transcript_1576/m.1748 type:complete len:88 (+) Transcript_1576:191-454(+)
MLGRNSGLALLLAGAGATDRERKELGHEEVREVALLHLLGVLERFGSFEANSSGKTPVLLASSCTVCRVMAGLRLEDLKLHDGMWPL